MWQAVAPDDAKQVLALLPPFPLALVSTRDNVLTVNQLHYFTFYPLRIGIAIAHSRHSHGLLTDEGAFVVNVPTADLMEAVQQCGRLSGRDGDKFARVGLTPVPSVAVAAVGVAECGARIACRVERQIPFESRTWFVGRVVAAWQRPGHDGSQALLCGRRAYHVPGEIVAER